MTSKSMFRPFDVVFKFDYPARIAVNGVITTRFNASGYTGESPFDALKREYSATGYADMQLPDVNGNPVDLNRFAFIGTTALDAKGKTG